MKILSNRHSIKFVVLSLLLLFGGNAFSTPTENKQQKTYTFGVVPQQSALILARLWQPLLKAVSERSGYRLEFRTTRNIPTFESRLLTGEYDFAYMNPYHFTVFSEKPGYMAIANERNKFLQGIIVVRKDSPIRSLEDLHEARLALPAPAAFAASILVRTELNSRGISYSPVYVGSHDSVYHSVTRGMYPAGGGIIRTLNNLKPGIRKQLRILWESGRYTPHAITAHPRVPRKVIDAVQQALVDLGQTEVSQAALDALNMHGFRQARKEDWTDVRTLNIELLNDLIKPR
jgi:phosphonate transport system substrate-binding protein